MKRATESIDVAAVVGGDEVAAEVVVVATIRRRNKIPQQKVS